MKILHYITQRKRAFTGLGLGLLLVLLSGCASSELKPLMPTPVLISELEVGPLDHVPIGQRWTPRQVYYVTTRERDLDFKYVFYTNKEAKQASLGLALVEFGDPDLGWDDLHQLSRIPVREVDVPLSISGIVEAGKFRSPSNPKALDRKGSTDWWLADLNASIDDARDKDILIYVHGAKVDFYNACIFAAQLDHFMGRDMTSIAFSWPTRQNIFAYSFGDDVNRAYRSAATLADLLELLAANSNARDINIVSWSAGGRLVTKALADLRARHPDLNHEGLQKKLRIGTVYFAASDVPRAEFLQALPSIDAISDRIVVTTSDNDGALNQAQRFMGGGPRIGQVASDLSEKEKQIVLATENLEVVDLSTGSEERGFNIDGHRYWFDHPWASSDVILAIRSDLDPENRGLNPTKNRIHWMVPPDYPERLHEYMIRPDLELRRPTK